MSTRNQCTKLLITCVDLFRPENCRYYARFSPDGLFYMELSAGIPAGFPKDYKQIFDLSGQIYQNMLELDLPEPYLKAPDFEELKRQADSLSFEGCAQFLLFWSRGNLKHGQEFFYKNWQEGTVLRILRRMVSQLESYQFPDERHVHRVYASIRPELGDLAEADVDAVVNPTNTQLFGNGAVERALHQKAGPELREFCKRCGPIPVGGTAWTSSFGLPAKSIIHVAVPSSAHPGAPYLLAACYANALDRVKDTDNHTIAFSAMGTGTAGIPAQEALRIAAQTIWSWTRRNPGKPMTVKVLFHAEEKLEFFKRELMLCVVREFRRITDPADMGVELRNSLPCILEEHGGLVKLPPERKKVADAGREAFYRLHSLYCELMGALYQMIGRPIYHKMVSDAVQRVSNGDPGILSEVFLNHLDEMELEECISYLVYLQRMDYAGGGTSHDHIRACSSGAVYRVLSRMEWLLRTE